MNKILLILTLVFIAAGILAQVPERMSYQAVVRNGKNELIANRQIGLRISIIQGSINGPEVYREIFSPNPVTNANGLFTAEIGSGAPILGTFSSINWGNGPYFIQSEIDTTGGTNYTLIGTTQMLSVPYALHAKTAEQLSGPITETDPTFAAWDKDYNDLSNKPDLSNYATIDMINQVPVSLDYNNLVNKPDLSNYATIDMINQNPASINYNDIVNKPDLSNYATIDMINQNNTNLDYNDLLNKPDLSNFVTKDMINQNGVSLDYNDLLNKPDLSNFATIDMINQNISSADYNDLSNRPDLSIYATKDMAKQNITNLADPVNAQDAATKAYIDSLLKRIDKLINENLLAGGFFDARDSTHYNMVKIGNQIWMAENLKYLPEVSDIPEKLSTDNPQYYVLDYDGTDVVQAKATENYNLYGVLYNWPAVMNGAGESNSNPSGVQGVCPDGWHLPGMNEWKQLVDHLGGEDVAAKKMMATGATQWQDNTGATNESGFTALPGGALLDAWGLSFVHNDALWWTSTLMYLDYENGNPKWYEYPSITGYNSNFQFWGIYDFVDRYGSGYSVRCVKD